MNYNNFTEQSNNLFPDLLISETEEQTSQQNEWQNYIILIHFLTLFLFSSTREQIFSVEKRDSSQQKILDSEKYSYNVSIFLDVNI